MSINDFGTARLSLRELSDAQRVQLHLLHGRQPHWNWVILLYSAIWPLAAIAMTLYSAWWVRLFGVIAIAISIQAMGILMHEAIHRNLFRRALLDRWAAFLFGIPAFFSGTAYRVAHLNHHQHTRTADDQDELSNLCRTDAEYRLLFYIWFAAGTFIYFFIVPWKALAIARSVDRRRIVVEYCTMLTIYIAVIAGCVTSGHSYWLLWDWLIPAQIAMLLSNIRGLAEHLCTAKTSVVSRTRTTLSNRLVSFLMLNLNYHLEHHLFPGIPWYNLPRAHSVLKTVYGQHGAHIEASYAIYAIQAFRYGPFREIRGQALTST